jgi:catechol 2,3-dioxygenase-like lactoylglutathione lyase family enzyme
MSQILGTWHFSFTVSDIEASVAFYRDLLGLELIHQQEQDNAYTRALVGFPDASLRIAQLAVPGEPRGISGHHLELVQYVVPKGAPFGPERNRPGAGHLAFCVADEITLELVQPPASRLAVQTEGAAVGSR